LCAQCYFGSEYQAYTVFAGARAFDGILQETLGKTCTCKGKHAAQAKGRAKDGSSLSAKKGVYVPRLCAGIASVVSRGLSSAPPAKQLLVNSRESRRAVQIQQFFEPLPGQQDAIAKAEWRIAALLFNTGKADLVAVAASSGAGWRLGQAQHVVSLTLTSEAMADLFAEKFLYGLEKMVASNASELSCDRPGFDWLLLLLARSRKEVHGLFLGSKKPHAYDGDRDHFKRAQRWAPGASLRSLEPEFEEALSIEPFPESNTPPSTEWENPPERIVDPPGPYTTAQLIPKETYDFVVQFGMRVSGAHGRSRRGTRGADVANSQRPEAHTFTEEEALNPCGRGNNWMFNQKDKMWHVLQPSSWPDDPPSTDLKALNILKAAEASGYPDWQQISWDLNGYPGVEGMERLATLNPHHMGAMRHTEELVEKAARDVKRGYVTHGYAFPDVWPCVIDPMNVIEQHDSSRLCIDKSLQLARYPPGHPKQGERVKPFNEYVDLAAELEAGTRISMASAKLFARALAIMLTCGLVVKIGKWDGKAFFRVHGKQRAHTNQSGRFIPFDGFGRDLRPNFGESHAPDHTGRESNHITWETRKQLWQLDQEYPPSKMETKVTEWLARRASLGEASGASPKSYRWAVLFWLCYFVDDAGLVVADSLLFRQDGTPKMIAVTLEDGTVVVRQQWRSELYFDCGAAVMNHFGHETPEEKMFRMSLRLVFLGDLIDVVHRSRKVSIEKRERYSECMRGQRARSETLGRENGRGVGTVHGEPGSEGAHGGG
jgi:hypothetical protein